MLPLCYVAPPTTKCFGSFRKLIITEHDEVGRVSVHVLGVQAAVEDLGVAAAAVNVLLVLDGELEDQRLVAVGEGLELGREGVELGVLARLDALALVGVAVKLSGCQDELSGVGTLVRGADPSLFPIFKKDFKKFRLEHQLFKQGEKDPMFLKMGQSLPLLLYFCHF